MIGEYDAGYENCINSMVNEAADMQFRIDSLQAENDKLCELVEKMARALGVGSDWCIRECGIEFGCWGDENGVTGSCAIVDTMEELGWPVVEVDE